LSEKTKANRSNQRSFCLSERELSELASLITGASYPKVSYASTKTTADASIKTKTKGASTDVKAAKLRELGKNNKRLAGAT
jgi:hypothetical protein